MGKRAESIFVAFLAGGLLGFLEEWLRRRTGLAWSAAVVGIVVAIASLVKQLALKFVLKSARPFPCGLLVYSDSPLWTSHIESKWLPDFGPKLVAWKLPSQGFWRTYIQRLFLKVYTASSSERELPVVIICEKGKAPSVLHFHDAFLDRKFGDEEALRNGERRLARELKVSPLQNKLCEASAERASNPAAPADQKALLPGS